MEMQGGGGGGGEGYIFNLTKAHALIGTQIRIAARHFNNYSLVELNASS